MTRPLLTALSQSHHAHAVSVFVTPLESFVTRASGLEAPVRVAFVSRRRPGADRRGGVRALAKAPPRRSRSGRTLRGRRWSGGDVPACPLRPGVCRGLDCAPIGVKRIELKYLNGPDIARLGPSDELILAAVERGLAAQGRGETVIEPRVHLHADPLADGHFN